MEEEPGTSDAPVTLNISYRLLSGERDLYLGSCEQR